MPRRKATFGSGLVLGFLVAAWAAIGAPWSSSVARAANDSEQPKINDVYTPQADDTDRPHDRSLLDKGGVDTARKQQAAEPAFYEKWQFWAVAGGAAVAVAGLIWGGLALAHVINGGDVKPCSSTTASLGCFGQGR
jgi:hypothetical protein